MKVRVELEISDELHNLIERLAKFLGCDPESVIQDRCRTHLESLPGDLTPYLEREVALKL